MSASFWEEVSDAQRAEIQSQRPFWERAEEALRAAYDAHEAMGNRVDGLASVTIPQVVMFGVVHGRTNMLAAMAQTISALRRLERPYFAYDRSTGDVTIRERCEEDDVSDLATFLFANRPAKNSHERLRFRDLLDKAGGELAVARWIMGHSK